MKNWSLNRKIWSVFGLLMFAFVVSVAVALMRMNQIRNEMSEIIKVDVKRDQMLGEIQDNQRVLNVHSREIILESNPEKMKGLELSFEKGVDEQRRDVRNYLAIASSEEKGIVNKYMDDLEKWLVEARRSRDLAHLNKDHDAAETLFTAQPILDRMISYLKELDEMTSKNVDERSADADAMAAGALWFCLIFSLCAIGATLALGYAVLREVNNSIGEVVRNLTGSSAQVSSASAQIASSAEELSQATSEQAASLEETAASIEEMNSMVAKNSENAKSAAETSDKSQTAVGQGKEVIRKMVGAMEAINRSSEGLADTVKIIEQIDKKTRIINEIVNKTELLSFNASVEAARAGEHGKGFAVVAEEVGKLARMSGSAAEEISTLLEESINKVNHMVRETKTSVETGSQVTTECGQVFEEIVQNVAKVSGMAGEIASASHEQTRGCGEITKAMNQLDQMTQQNASTSEECASAAEELSAQAESLKTSVGVLYAVVNGGERARLSDDSTATHAPATPRKDNVIKLKGPRRDQAHANGHAPQVSEGSVKKAASGAPSYQSTGFSDV